MVISYFIQQKSRDSQCMFLKVDETKKLFGFDGCSVGKEGKEDERYYVTCKCSHTTTFGILSKPGVETNKEEKSYGSNGLILFTVTVGVICMIICVVLYFLMGLVNSLFNI